MSEEITDAVEMLGEIREDSSVPKNIKDKIEITIKVLKDKGNLKVSINKAMQELDEIADDPNLEPYTRSQIWNIVSILEKAD